MPINDRDYSPSLLDRTFGEGANGRLKELEPEHARSGARNHVEIRSASPRIRRGPTHVSAGSAADHGNFGFAHAHAAARSVGGDDKNRGANVNIVGGRCCRGAGE